MSDKDPFESRYEVALYKSLTSEWVHVANFYGDDDTEYHGGMVRISEPVAVRFEKLSSEAAIRNAIETLTAAEKKVLAELNQKLTEIRAQKSQLLALTHQPEAA